MLDNKINTTSVNRTMDGFLNIRNKFCTRYIHLIKHKRTGYIQKYKYLNI